MPILAPIPMMVGGVVTDQAKKPLAGVSVSVFNSKRELLKDPSTGKPLTSVTKIDGKYMIIYGFNGIATGVDLDVSPRPPLASFRVKINPGKGGTQNIVVPIGKSVSKPDYSGSHKDGYVGDEPKDDKKDSWLKKNKWYVVGGSVVLAGIVTLIIVLSRKGGKGKK